MSDKIMVVFAKLAFALVLYMLAIEWSHGWSLPFVSALGYAGGTLGIAMVTLVPILFVAKLAEGPQ